MTETNRTCGDCTACCDGWLSGVVNGREFYPGSPCHYSGCNGCSIYEERPESPCKTYSCEWLKSGHLPEWMKPNKSGVIVTGKEWTHPDGSKHLYLDVIETGKKIDSVVLNWLFKFNLRTGIPLSVQIDGGRNKYGTKEFLEATGGVVA